MNALRITKQLVRVTRASLGIQLHKTDLSKPRSILFFHQLLTDSSNMSQAAVSPNGTPTRPASQTTFRTKRIYYSLEGELHRGLIRFRSGIYELRHGPTEQVLLSFDASSEITFVNCEEAPQEMYAYSNRDNMFLIFETRNEATVFKKHLMTSKRLAAPEDSAIRLHVYPIARYNVFASSIRRLLTAYDEIENLKADIQAADEAQDEQASHNHPYPSYVSTGTTVHGPQQADRIQELETELSRLQAEARSRGEELRSRAQAYDALNTKFGKARQEEQRLRTERDKALKANKSWKTEN
jgi:hypothetical protein